MELLTTKAQIIAEIKRRYEGVTRTSRNDETGVCLYSHALNGVGCAIGCLFDAEDASKLDDITYSSSIDTILDPANKRHDARRAIVRARIDPNIDRQWLSAVQKAHDGATSVPDFLAELDWLI